MNGEVIFLQLIDVGRSINLEEAKKSFQGVSESKIFETKDTPEYIRLPKPLNLEILQTSLETSAQIGDVKVQIKMYEDGVISTKIRINLIDFPLSMLHTIRKIEMKTNKGFFTPHQILLNHHNEVIKSIDAYIEKYSFSGQSSDAEHYAVFCITDKLDNPENLIKDNEKYFAALLTGENPNLKLHPRQIEKTLKSSHSFLYNDLIIFDFHRSLIIDPNRDYEDVLYIIELANFQRLKLRTIDRLLDVRLDIAEDDIREIFFKKRLIGRKLNRKLGGLFKLRYDLIFILENLENVSKIIGDYFLANIYNHLNEIFKLDQWIIAIRNRLNILNNLYSSAKADASERILLYLEILLSFVFIIEFIFLILGLY